MEQKMMKCPQCGTQIELTEVLSKDIEATLNKKYEERINDIKQQATTREKEWEEKFKVEQQKILAKAKSEAEASLKVRLMDLETQLNEKSKKLEHSEQKELELLQKERILKEKEKGLIIESEKKIATKEDELRKELERERKTIEEKARKQAEMKTSMEAQDLKTQLEEAVRKLESSEKQELELRKKQRELEQREKNIELEAMRKLDSEKQILWEDAMKQSEEKYRLKDLEKDKQLSDMKKRIDELQRKTEQGSQQVQGEVLEADLEIRLKAKFLYDDIEPIQKGIKGADILQTIKSSVGHICGKILWESKRTKAWKDEWVQKGKDDQLRTKADLVVIMSEALPKGLQQFDIVNGVWITDISSAINLAVALRIGMIQLSSEKALQAGRQGKMEVVYNYLIGSEFKNRVEAIVGSFITMKGDLEAEKRAMDKIWAKREKQIERVIQNISGMHGDLEGVVGKTLPVVKILELSPQAVEIEANPEDIRWEEN